MMKDRFCIAFAGVVGSSKSPIANYLSWNLDLPIYNNDIIRTEVQEDLLHFDKDEYLRRRDKRGKKIIASSKAFIYDASADREWKRLNDWLHQGQYVSFVISLDLSRDLLNKIYTAKGYTEGYRLELLMTQHEDFLKEHADVVNLHISDRQFADRLELSLRAVKKWMTDK